MTIQEMHDLVDLLIDKANAPWFTAAEKDKFITLAQIEFLDNSYRFFEYNEEVREKLLPLVRSQNFGAGQISNINLSSITDFRYILSLRGTFPDGCGGDVVKPIPPIQLDDEVANQLDPFNVNDDDNPGYIQENDGTNSLVQLVSTTDPTNVILKYLKTPVDTNVSSVPAINCELSEAAHEEIVNIAVRKMLGNIQDQFGYQQQTQESQIQ